MIVLAFLILGMQQSEPLSGKWELILDAGTPVDPWRTLTLDVRIDGTTVFLTRTWTGSGGVQGVDSLRVAPDGSSHDVPMRSWLDNRHLGVRVDPGATRDVSALWKDGGRTLAVEQRMTVLSSQGAVPLRIYSEYRLAPDADVLELIELRSTRARPIFYAFRRVSEAS